MSCSPPLPWPEPASPQERMMRGRHATPAPRRHASRSQAALEDHFSGCLIYFLFCHPCHPCPPYGSNPQHQSSVSRLQAPQTHRATLQCFLMLVLIAATLAVQANGLMESTGHRALPLMHIGGPGENGSNTQVLPTLTSITAYTLAVIPVHIVCNRKDLFKASTLACCPRCSYCGPLSTG